VRREESASAAPLLDFAALGGRLRRVLPVLTALAVLGAGIEALGAGVSPTLVVRWASILVALVLAALAVLTGLHALDGADRAQRRGERLSGGDVGLMPPRPGGYGDGAD
jgi:hypothetical protein